jgi:dimethylamine/trimethylamine dehydrogenase
MGGVVAEALKARGLDVTLVTTAGHVSAWTQASLEQPYIQAQLIEKGIDIIVNHQLQRIGTDAMTLTCAFTGREQTVQARSAMLVTARIPDDALFRTLAADPERLSHAGIVSLHRIGDCSSPGTIAAAIHAGHRFAREFGESVAAVPGFRIEHLRHEARQQFQ